jgi:alpha-beta hydrolase superfamily lysophospholipase
MGKVEEYYFLSANGVNKIHTMKWIPDGEPVGVVQLVHGMVEFIKRYDGFAKYLNEQGLLVVGHDHIGHGESVNSEDEWGYFSPNGAEDALKDMVTITKTTKEAYPDLPYIIFGHSMGSFFTRKYAILHGDLVDGVVVCGTGHLPTALGGLARGLNGIIRLFRGDKYRSKLMNDLVLGNVLDRIENPRTSCDWLCKDEEIVDAYVANPANQFLFTMNGIRSMVGTIQYAVNPKRIANMDNNLPVLVVSGAEDPIGGYGKNVKIAYDLFEKADIKDVSMHLFEGDRHEILNELDREDVYKYIYDWMKVHVLSK